MPANNPRRDPRDILQSMLGFNKKRGFLSFSVRHDESQSDFLERFIDDRKRRLRVLLEVVPHEASSAIVRYEEMVLDLPGVAARLSERLGVHLDAHDVRARQQDFSHHMSSQDPKASLARWKRELDEATRKRFADEMGAELEALGYEV